jgi:hypothetical protein
MKALVKLLTLCPVALVALTINAQDTELFQQKIDHYRNHKDIGVVMAVVSIPVTVYAVSVFKDGVNFSYEDHPDNQWQGADLVLAGIVIGVVGIGMLAGGVILYSNGNRKMKQYQTKLNELKAGTYYTPNQFGITLTYRF